MQRKYKDFLEAQGKFGRQSIQAISDSESQQPTDLNTHESAVWETACTVIAPLLVAFTQWLKLKSERAGYDTLFFLARDGQIIEQVFNILFPAISTKYLLVSRQSLFLPTISKFDHLTIEWVLAPTTKLTREIAFGRLGIKPSELRDPIFSTLDLIPPDTQLTENDRKLISSMLQNQEFWDFISPRMKRQRALLRTYLDQTGFTDCKKASVIDAGWSGSLQKALIDASSRTQCDGYYFGVSKRKVDHSQGVQYGFLFEPESPRSTHLPTGYLVPVIEMFCSADHAGVKRYHRLESGTVEPKLQTESDRLKSWPLEVQQQAIKTFAKVATESSLDFGQLGHEKCLTIVGSLLRLFVDSPSSEEAEYFGCFEDAEDQNEAYSLPLARPYSVSDLVKLKRQGFAHHHNEWVGGSFALSNWLIRSVASKWL